MMKVIEVPTDGLASLLGKRVLLMCANYSYTGKLAGVNKTYVVLEDAAIVYETGAWDDASWKDAQKLPKPTAVRIQFIESWMESTK